MTAEQRRIVRRRRVLDLRARGLEYAEIAKSVGCSVPTVKRDMKKLRSTFSPDLLYEAAVWIMQEYQESHARSRAAGDEKNALLALRGLAALMPIAEFIRSQMGHLGGTGDSDTAVRQFFDDQKKRVADGGDK